MYDVRLDLSVKKFLKKLDGFSQKKIIKKLRQLRSNPFIGKPLTANLSGLRRLRVHKYRIIYKIIKNKLIILVLDIGHRKNIY